MAKYVKYQQLPNLIRKSLPGILWPDFWPLHSNHITLPVRSPVCSNCFTLFSRSTSTSTNHSHQNPSGSTSIFQSTSSVNASIRKELIVPTDLIKPEIIMALLIYDISIVITFGLCSPPLIFIICCVVFYKGILYRVMLGRFVKRRLTLILEENNIEILQSIEAEERYSFDWINRPSNLEKGVGELSMRNYHQQQVAEEREEEDDDEEEEDDSEANLPQLTHQSKRSNPKHKQFHSNRLNDSTLQVPDSTLHLLENSLYGYEYIFVYTVYPVLGGSILFYSGLCWDMMSDSIGWKHSIWLPVVIVFIGVSIMMLVYYSARSQREISPSKSTTFLREDEIKAEQNPIRISELVARPSVSSERGKE